MLNTKFDLYNAEWLDVVFDDRNKAYGAYDLRSHYAGTLNKAMAIAFTVVISGAVALSFAFKTVPVETGIIRDVDLSHFKLDPPIKPKEEKAEKPKPAAPEKPQPQVTTIQHLSTVVKPDDQVTKEPVENIDLQTAAISSETVKGVDPGEGGNIPEPSSGGGGTAVKGNSDEIVPFDGSLEVNPEPYGGMAAFGKFLGKNMRFPAQAQDANVSGRVIMSFVIEKNGEISNISVIREAGFGFDQEATRVLKLAKAWKPGMQNGQPVRVRYTIPINFQLPAE
nr:energy transducer TonB [uncultured Mucilaginibacter sp.]